MESKIYNQKGESVGSLKLPENVFGIPWNADLVHQVISSLKTNARTPVAHTKSRADVRGGGKKPWRQKGTGRARHGSTRSPIWVGGGVTHGPRNDKNFERKINKKMKAKALYTILSQKYRDGEILFVDKLSLKEPKTKDAKQVLTKLSSVKGFEKMLSKKSNSAYIALGDKDKNVEKSFANMGNIEVNETRNINPLDVLSFKYLVISDPEKSLGFIGTRLVKAETK